MSCASTGFAVIDAVLEMPDNKYTSDVTVTCYGASGTVTGSCFLLGADTKSILIDCGIFQGTRTLEKLNYEPLPFDVTTLDAVILTHAHLDHSGRLPYLVASGYRGPIWCTSATADIIEPMLMDSVKLQEAEVARRNRRHDRKDKEQYSLLFDSDDIKQLMSQVEIAEYCDQITLEDGVSFRLWNARHIVGSASVEVEIGGQRLLFSGDLGAGLPLACGTIPVGGYDHIFCESTYGDRVRVPSLVSERREKLAIHVEQTLGRGGNLLIPAFAVERTQTLLEDFCHLFKIGRLSNTHIFVDSPLAHKVTAAMLGHRDSGIDLLNQPNIRFTKTVGESKSLNMMSGIVVIAGSGMCTGGRIRHHLRYNLPDRKSRVLMVGFQVAGTLGSILIKGAQNVRISGDDIPVRADIEVLDAYSNHADQAGLIKWIRARKPIKQTLFLIHGERKALDSLQALAAEESDVASVVVPSLGESWILRTGVPAELLKPQRQDADTLTSENDWVNMLAAFRSKLEPKLSSMPDYEQRKKVMAALNDILEQA